MLAISPLRPTVGTTWNQAHGLLTLSVLLLLLLPPTHTFHTNHCTYYVSGQLRRITVQHHRASENLSPTITI
ncbi:hypothetical protein BJ878DRAFT_508127 [Calycina marina]|uniref:Secreted protein n=1 Tax=Calycina marina TaxID=1763456 RepID=A0A9P7Z2C9_9HELO|nr:hypothetical protein BJ878DRAFT_508127 [Calycina marina]